MLQDCSAAKAWDLVRAHTYLLGQTRCGSRCVASIHCLLHCAFVSPAALQLQHVCQHTLLVGALPHGYHRMRAAREGCDGTALQRNLVCCLVCRFALCACGPKSYYTTKGGTRALPAPLDSCQLLCCHWQCSPASSSMCISIVAYYSPAAGRVATSARDAFIVLLSLRGFAAIWW